MKITVRCCTLVLKRYFRSKSLIVLSCILILAGIGKLANTRDLFSGGNSVVTRVKVKTTTLRTPILLNPERLKRVVLNKKLNQLNAKKNATEMKMKWLREKVERLNRMVPKPEVVHVEVNEVVPVNKNIHIFYYAWYENEAVDGAWQHWNHEYLKNWRQNDKKVYPTGRHKPPDDIGSNFYPKLGCYSSRDQNVLNTHMRQIRDVGVGVLIVSWYPPGMSDGPSKSSDTVFRQLLDTAEKFQLKVSPHVEPYVGRNPLNFLQHLKYFTKTYGSHPALYRMKRRNRNLIVYYVYDSYRTPAFAWKELLATNGNISVRGTEEDGIFLGLLVDASHKVEIKRARFDGFYTYFATNGFSYGSTWKNWKTLAAMARQQDLIFVPSVGPGYVDTRIRPWNSANTRHRRHGKYYEVGWRTALSADVQHISITSFNEWHEGTQIEPAVRKTIQNYSYLDYEPEGPDFYMNLTKFWVNTYTKKNFNTKSNYH
ncbi:hypothetical protein RUM43_010457 [Polyplax serrata]|uniref:Glycoprotein endo-alpha-1,2-mannosidase n=1 Tax=Polyplax serrata TaxID=468196 RepID=A0AAN8P7D5_POLSC